MKPSAQQMPIRVIPKPIRLVVLMLDYLRSMPQVALLSFKIAPDFEKPGDAGADNVYNLKVSVKDAGKLHSDSKEIKITVLDVNDNAPVLTNDTKTIDENTADETVVYTLNASDADLDALTYSLPANNNYYIDGNQIKVKADADLDFESANKGTQLLVVTVNDGTKTSTGTITIKLKNINDNAPVLTNDTKTIDENTADETVVYTLNASDADLDALTYSLPANNNYLIPSI